MVFLDVHRKAVEALDDAESVRRGVIEAGILHRGGPQPSPSVARHRIAVACLLPAVNGIRLRRSRRRVQPDEAIAIGADPQVAALGPEAVGIDVGQCLLARIGGEVVASHVEAAQTAVVGGYPHLARRLTEAADDTAAEQLPVGGEGGEALAHGREIGHAPVEGAHPQATLAVACHGVDEALGGGRIVAARDDGGGAGLKVIVDESLLTTEIDMVGDTAVDVAYVKVQTVDHGWDELRHTAVAVQLQQALRPRGEQHGAFRSLCHAHDVNVFFKTVNRHHVEGLAGLVEMIDAAMGLGDGPYLIGVVGKHIVQDAVGLVDGIVRGMSGGRMVAEDALAPGGHPYVAVGINGKGVDKAVELLVEQVETAFFYV